MRPVLAPNRSDSMDTLLALGKAATNTITFTAKGSSGRPRRMAAVATSNTSKGCTISLIKATGQKSRAGMVAAWLSRACKVERANTAPIVNNATGEAASANKPRVCSTGAGQRHCVAEVKAPKPIAQGMGLAKTPWSALRAAWLAPWAPAPSMRDSAMHKEHVKNKSTKMVTIAGPADCGPNKATSKGTPMKPVFGKAATSAPKEASFQRIRRFKLVATVNATSKAAHSK